MASKPVDPEALFDALVAENVVAETDDGVRTTEAFDHALSVYEDTYADLSDAEFRESVADAFDLPDAEAAADAVDAADLTPETFGCYLALGAFVDGEYTGEQLGAMTEMVAGLVPESPVPASLTELDDDSYEAFLAERGDCVVSVWKRHCEPCEAQKARLADLLAAAPDGVAFAGVDGESVPEFCTTFEVNAAPAFVLFRDGDHRETATGLTATADLEERLRAVYAD